MTMLAKWSATNARPKFTDRLALAQPLLAAGALTFFTLVLGLPILFLLNSAFSAELAPAGVMADYRLGSVYNDVAAWLHGPLSSLVADGGGLNVGGVFVATLAFTFFAWAIAMVLLSQWRAQLPVLEDIVPARFLVAVVLTFVLTATLFWLCRMAGGGMQATGGLGLALIFFLSSFFIILAWYFALTGNFISWPSLLVASFSVAFSLTVFVWVLGVIVPAETASLSGFTKALIVLAHLFGLWLILVMGVHFLARQTLEQSDWQDIDTLSRGQQVDFALAIMKTLGHADNANRWMPGRAVSTKLGAKHSVTVQALRRLNEFDLVRASQATNRPDHWRLSTESLHAVNLQDLMEAFGATLDPSGGVYEEGPQQAMLALADQEKRIMRTDLATLTRGDRGPALTSDAPAFISLLTDKGIGTETDAAGAPPPITDAPKAYERLTALLDKEATVSQTPASQLISENAVPAFSRPLSKPNPVRAAEPEEGSDLKETIGLTAAGGIAATGLASLIGKVDDEAAAAEAKATLSEPEVQETLKPSQNEDAVENAADVASEAAGEAAAEQTLQVESDPVVATGLASLVSELPENLGSYTLALVSGRGETRAET